jgi:phosphatidate cytidylyltransferase
MLRERVITALVLLALLIPAVMSASPLPFAVLTLILIAAAGWEWARLCGLPPAAAVASGVVLGAACACIGLLWEIEIPAEAWGAITVLWIARRRARAARRARTASATSTPCCASSWAGC